MTDLPKTYTLVEVAEALGMSERWVRQEISKGAEHLRGGHKIRFTETQYELLRSSLVKNPTDAKQSITTGRKRKS